MGNSKISVSDMLLLKWYFILGWIASWISEFLMLISEGFPLNIPYFFLHNPSTLSPCLHTSHAVTLTHLHLT